MSPKLGGSKIPAQLRKTLLKASLNEDLIVTPQYEAFLMKNPNLTVPPRIAKQLAKLMSTPQRDRRYSWSASSAGYCKRRQELAFLGAEAPRTITPQLQAIFYNGTWTHLRWQAVLLTAGILDAIEVTVKKPSLAARATLDGMGIAKQGRYKGETFGWELKGRNEFDYNKQLVQGVDDKTRRQVNFQLLMSGLDVWVITNENKNTQDFHEWVIYRDEALVADCEQEVRSLNSAIERKRLHPMLPECKRREAEFHRCPFGGLGGACVMSGTWPNGL